MKEGVGGKIFDYVSVPLNQIVTPAQLRRGSRSGFFWGCALASPAMSQTSPETTAGRIGMNGPLLTAPISHLNDPPVIHQRNSSRSEEHWN